MGSYSMTYGGYPVVEKKNILSTIDTIGNLLDYLSTLEQTDLPVKHYFSEGVYAREIFMPADTIVIGKIHRTKHLNIISRGKCKVVTPLRSLHITGPYTFESFVGEQKALYIKEDTVWTTIHVTKETDPDKIVEFITVKDYDNDIVESLMGEYLCLSQ